MWLYVYCTMYLVIQVDHALTPLIALVTSQVWWHAFPEPVSSPLLPIQWQNALTMLVAQHWKTFLTYSMLARTEPANPPSVLPMIVATRRQTLYARISLGPRPAFVWKFHASKIPGAPPRAPISCAARPRNLMGIVIVSQGKHAFGVAHKRCALPAWQLCFCH